MRAELELFNCTEFSVERHWHYSLRLVCSVLMAQSDERINKELLLARIQELEKAVATLRAELEGNRKPSNSGAAQTPLPVSTERNSVNLSAFSLSHPAVSRLYSVRIIMFIRYFVQVTLVYLA